MTDENNSRSKNNLLLLSTKLLEKLRLMEDVWQQKPQQILLGYPPKTVTSLEEESNYLLSIHFLIQLEPTYYEL